jgi:hypothetical protein
MHLMVYTKLLVLNIIYLRTKVRSNQMMRVSHLPCTTPYLPRCSQILYVILAFDPMCVLGTSAVEILGVSGSLANFSMTRI